MMDTCSRGHPWTEENSYFYKRVGYQNLHRMCKICNLEGSRLKRLGKKLPTINRKQVQIKQFWSYIKKTEDCWLWTGPLRDGYGRIKIGKKLMQAHRFSYELEKEKIEIGFELDHLCRVRNCVNPKHLEIVTRQENILRGVSFAARESKQTHCKHGHLFDEKNTIIRPGGGRKCRTCNNKTRSRV